MLLPMIFANLKIVFSWIIQAVKFISLYWVYAIWPILYCTAVISDRYWGNDNKFEQTIEAINKLKTGISIDISSSSGKKVEKDDLKKYVPGER